VYPNARHSPAPADHFPAVQYTTQSFESAIELGSGLVVLQEMVVSLARETAFFDERDAASAYPSHALLMANSDASLAVVLQIFELRPSLMALTTSNLVTYMCVHVLGGLRQMGYRQHVKAVGGRCEAAGSMHTGGSTGRLT